MMRDPALDVKTTCEPFTNVLWRAIEPINDALKSHPFLVGLTTGDLERDRFAFYIVQDALYLVEFAQALSALAAFAPDPADSAMFNRHAADAIAVENALHGGLIVDLGLDSAQVKASELAPTCRAYVSHLKSTVLGRPFHEGLAAVLPCYWIYQDVGQRLAAQGSPDPLYARWIATYGGAEFEAVTRQVLDLTDRLAPTLTPDQRAAMTQQFVLSSRYEWMFWDMAFRREAWPV
ncbi:thiaminase;4-amino-5-aminomethyl-2-methylpyrimidine deaminase [Isosphaera pallida ATCC 43644]|jgi:thiaminase/transcriptional activator TenA|uniref:Aminopyrimidine aminohydrolase n=1 Tax=Isosphaera pallida (strain ATCC 43644 / DSM 9630 / IS1B) TaxID=575540 RepID=E8R377_ISOPI|nr:thiaminase II [Isosphaera pallida]ADV62596.1 thiaminase;4-amino-5-aminomethyl-2-methylpyrimidine deaminase [Isosphaera pallida ATCC 43644]